MCDFIKPKPEVIATVHSSNPDTEEESENTKDEQDSVEASVLVDVFFFTRPAIMNNIIQMVVKNHAKEVECSSTRKLVNKKAI